MSFCAWVQCTWVHSQLFLTNDLCEKQKEFLSVKSWKIKLMLSSQASSQRSTSNYYSRHKRATKSPHHSSDQRGWPPDCYDTHSQLLVLFNLYRFFQNSSLWAMNERKNQRTRELANTTLLPWARCLYGMTRESLAVVWRRTRNSRPQNPCLGKKCFLYRTS